MRKHLLYAAAAFAAFFIARAQDRTSAQSPSKARPEFEVTSIKECKPADRPPPSTSTPGRLSLSCRPLWRLIAEAYETFAAGKVDPLNLLVPMPLEGTPEWANSARYTIDAKAEGPQSGAMMRGPMMQALLEDRFQVKVHRETREVSGYLMTVAKGGLKAKPTEEGSCNRVDPTDLTQSLKAMPCNMPRMIRNGPLVVYDVRGISLDVFSRMLHPDGRSVIDRTGLTGPFDIHLEWEADAPNSSVPDSGEDSDPSPHASLTVATREQLGLQLAPGKGRRELLVIDRVKRPSGN